MTLDKMVHKHCGKKRKAYHRTAFAGSAHSARGKTGESNGGRQIKKNRYVGRGREFCRTGFSGCKK